MGLMVKIQIQDLFDDFDDLSGIDDLYRGDRDGRQVEKRERELTEKRENMT